jgi:hypothetical protein
MKHVWGRVEIGTEKIWKVNSNNYDPHKKGNSGTDDYLTTTF